jgi:cathepsin L
MKTIFLAYLALFTTVYGFQTSQQYEDTLNSFHNYLVKYDKFYFNPHEYWQRFHAFTNTDRIINEHNSDPTKTWKMGHNQFSDQHPFEVDYLRSYLGKSDTHGKNIMHKYDFSNPLPDSVDWRANGYVTPVKDQGQCGSCWAFSSTGAMEGQHAKATGNLTPLSEQNLVDCATDCFGCGGGWMDKAMQYVVNNGGVDTESSYPYTAQDGTCSFNKTNVGATFSKVVDIPAGDCDSLLHAVATVGPISVAVNANGIMNYQTGIYTESQCDPTDLDHGVLVVGYGQTPEGKKYWIVKNSWNTNWGQDGYIYWDRDNDDMCGICQASAYPLV